MSFDTIRPVSLHVYILSDCDLYTLLFDLVNRFLNVCLKQDILIHTYFLRFLYGYLKGKVTWREQDRDLPCAVSPPQMASTAHLGQSEGRNQELLPGVLHQ